MKKIENLLTAIVVLLSIIVLFELINWIQIENFKSSVRATYKTLYGY